MKTRRRNSKLKIVSKPKTLFAENGSKKRADLSTMWEYHNLICIRLKSDPPQFLDRGRSSKKEGLPPPNHTFFNAFKSTRTPNELLRILLLRLKRDYINTTAYSVLPSTRLGPGKRYSLLLLLCLGTIRKFVMIPLEPPWQTMYVSEATGRF